VDLYSTFIVARTQNTQEQITQFYLQIAPYLPLSRKHEVANSELATVIT